MYKNLLKIKLFILIIAIQISSMPCFANKPVIPKPITTPGPTETNKAQSYFVDSFIPFFTKSFVQIAGIVAVLFMIYAGVQLLTAYGNEEKIGEAKKAAIYAAVGFLITLLSYAIISILNSLKLF